MRLNRMVLLAGLAGFASGALVMRFEARRGARTLLLAEPLSENAPVCVVQPAERSEPRGASVGRPLLFAAPAITETLPRPPLRRPGATAISKPQEGRGDAVEQRLVELLEHPLPQGREIGRNDRDDGSMLTYEQLDDGTTINRGYSRKGELLEEGMYTLEGEGIEKSYYDTGTVKGLSWTRADGTRIDVKLGPGGNFEGRQDTLPDGSKLVTKYDSNGNVAGRWRVARNGRTIPVQD